ncbi:hypothetical protein OV203_28920 [Nannocystis sp. ILAH1]|uniref:hypothetical protein n=1 Tax=unclassified Nannocystis TaxID=2627009 RepID=UPI0022708C80|nr:MULTISPECIES: hypothetical protein [unclassified Nannocystis]MCY0991203.1 hypothetical protein [Nannocystis sp. ILAH1]MCY1064717.1 hypothetical protein [Nannocystis sp. RBIL2]
MTGPAPGTVWLVLSLREHMLPTGLGFFAWYEAMLAPKLAALEAADAVLAAREQALTGTAADGPELLQLAREWMLRGDLERTRDALARARRFGCEPGRDALADFIVPATAGDHARVREPRLRVLLGAGFPLPPLSRPALRLRLGQCLMDLDRDEEAIEVLTPLLDDGSSVQAAVRRALAVALFEAGRASEALALVQAKPDRWLGGPFVCRCLLALGRRDEALATLETVPVEERSAYLLFKFGALAEAEALLEREIQREAPYLRWVYQLALVLAHRGEAARADAALQRALQLGFPIAEVVADADALPLRATEAYRRWTAPDPPLDP